MLAMLDVGKTPTDAEKDRVSVNDEQYEETVTYNEIEKGENNSAEYGFSILLDMKVHYIPATHRTLDPGGTSIWSGKIGSRPWNPLQSSLLRNRFLMLYTPGKMNSWKKTDV